MSRLISEIHYELDGVFVDPDALGLGFAFRRDKFQIGIELPAAADSFNFVRPTITLGGVVYDDDPREPTKQPLVALLQRGNMREIRVIRVTTKFDADFCWSDSPNWNESPGQQLVESVRNQVWSVCDSAVEDFTDWIMTAKGQVWGSLVGEFPKAISMLQITDADEGKPFPASVRANQRFRVIGAESIFRRADFVEVATALNGGGSSSFAELLLAEAKHYTWSNERFAPDRAILLAAMACEVAIKEALRRGSADQVKLVDLLLSNPRDWSLSAEGLWDKASLAVLGRSLRLDLPDVWKPLTTLFSKRNSIVHRGGTVEMSEAKPLVSGAEGAFGWLNGVCG